MGERFREEKGPLLWRLLGAILMNLLIAAAVLVAILTIVWDWVSHLLGGKR